MTTQQYLEQLNRRYKTGISREHTYRKDLEDLLISLVKDIDVTNEPANVTDCGNPDYVITKKDIPIGYIEAKDIGKDLNSKNYKEQFNRYRKALDNLIITDYIRFQFFKEGELITQIEIATIENGEIKPKPENFQQFENLIKDFCTYIGQTIRSPKKLAQMMAGKARLLQNTLETALTKDIGNGDSSDLKAQYETFKNILIHDLSPRGFADIYAQTLAYGMFAARYHDEVLDTFSRQEAAEKIPKTNPFLRMLFDYVAGTNIDDRIKHTVDNLADVFRAVDLRKILSRFGRSTKTQDPIVHFYEDFLSEYDSKLRKAKGVWYTPQPVVSFIVRAVDEVLKSEFSLSQGLADTTKTKINIDSQTTDKRAKSGYKQIEKEVHKVQVLDPATGTGTFLAEAIKFIYNNNFKTMQGAWSGYVEEHLISRLNGFELLMASYAMAHLKLDMLLTDTGYKPKSTQSQRFHIYLTNSLEEHHPDTGTLFANWLSNEANEANQIKKDTPVMVVMGNPPYSGESANKGQWIMDLMEDYKKEPTGGKLKERNPKWINDDYVKFMRYGQYYIEKNGSGILAFINPHGFLDNPTFRGMRYSLLKTYDKIYTIDLHGNSKKKETCPDGSKDENVFDIMQGVSINILIKTGAKKNNELAEVYHCGLYGKRNDKYEFLAQNSLKNIQWSRIENTAPQYYFVQKDWELKKQYDSGFSLKQLMTLNSLGILTKRDILTIDFEEDNLKENISMFTDKSQTVKSVCDYFNISVKDKDKWDAEKARLSIDNNLDKFVKDIEYRPFDSRKIFYQNQFIARPNEKIFKHFKKENISLVVCRQGQAVGGDDWNVLFISKSFTDQNVFRRGGGTVFPLYLYPDDDSLDSSRVPNLDMTIVKEIEKSLGLEFVAERPPRQSATATPPQEWNTEFSSLGGVPCEARGGGSYSKTFAPIDIFDYIYAVLHSPSYREKYKEFLKIDFPRVPYPTIDTFWQLVELGGQLRQIHLLESPVVTNYTTSYPIDGDNTIDKLSYKDGKVYINKEQYFDTVPEVAWNFYIGGYQPAQKWLKDRKGRELNFEDILHYQKIIVALIETDRLMQEIDTIEF
ncbi:MULTISPECIES: type ISP restriction/modification enzyme [Francisella]|uniref:site-specific DNA-methyltransferase (adenine-specific) n=1 Tax=Francisella opportunistica TaxID=2016517 RepID=A0A345JSF8_9GAMM|nr:MULTISPECIES: type ISP restriction/modification enzyme [Francisella]APC92020.1 adenine specific DNA methyltransferase [Francisella sp. MA067296]AXH30254.1 DNA methyltransferase [Francisella opportunistica]AXH31895.1 DNA methyltransferase [Francisella opportunistica]AXH33541.1 DNA methyltransferase [Francisella opportunistica]